MDVTRAPVNPPVAAGGNPGGMSLLKTCSRTKIHVGTLYIMAILQSTIMYVLNLYYNLYIYNNKNIITINITIVITIYIQGYNNNIVVI